MTIERIIDKRTRDLGGGFVVGRVLPFHARRMVGPYIFFDHLGPLELAPGIPRELDVRPHPHIGLATVTYLYSGQITHRDSLGYEQEIRPGEVNWMVAGSGITHSERLEYARSHGANMHGIQAWVALPLADEETDPSFDPERAVSCASGEVTVGGTLLAAGQMAVLAGRDAVDVEARQPSTVMVLGGEPIGERFLLWNFVSSSKERLEQAAEDWRQQRMKLPVGDDREFTPMPEAAH